MTRIRWMLGVTALALAGTATLAANGPPWESDEDDAAGVELVRLPTRIPATVPVEPSPPATGQPFALGSSFDQALSAQSLPPVPRPAPIMLGDYAGRGGTAKYVRPRTTIVTRIVQDPRTDQPIVIKERVTVFDTFRAYVPGGARQFKIADNESPMPQDRVFAAFNYFNDYGYAIHNRLGIGELQLDAYRTTVGIEKTFCCGAASVGLRLPLLGTRVSGTPWDFGGGGGQTGDLSLIFKYAPWRNVDTGDLISVGLAVTLPTGDGENNPFHGTLAQPFLGYLKNWGRWYVLGFFSIETPIEESDDVTMIFNDLGIGYRLWECPGRSGCLTAVIPTAEVHVNTPLNHRGVLNNADPAATPDTVDLTVGAHLEFFRQARLTLGGVVPVTGPRPFQVELIAFLNVRF